MGSVSQMRHKQPSTLREHIDVAIDDMDWLSGSDQGAVGLARLQADAIDADPDLVAKVGPHLMATLAELGGTPGARKALGVEAKVKGKLAQLREQAARGKAG